MNEKSAKFRLICLGLLMLCSVASAVAQKQFTKRVFSDEFNGKRNAPIDKTKWTAELGGEGWGNKELQYYIDSTETAYHNGKGSLVIKAIKKNLPDSFKCWYGPCQYTSARLITRDKFEQKYGRFEARIKIPRGQGVWPAFWMLGNDITKVGWPQSGEIDIMENIGKEPSTIYGTAHGPGFNGSKAISQRYFSTNKKTFADDFHIYAVEWQEKEIRWYVDGKLYHTITPEKLPPDGKWVFDHPFFVLLNFAVGGNWGGDPDAATVFPQEMLIDYVRVYQ